MFLIFVIRLSWSNVKKNVNLNLSQNFVRFSLIISYKDDKTYRAMSIMSLDKEGWSRFDTAHFSSKFSWQTILRIGWEVRIKSIHNIGYKTAFYTSLYLLLSDSIPFNPKHSHHFLAQKFSSRIIPTIILSLSI